jgi:hypothetical protein
MKCPKCGKEINDAAVVCKHCGTAILDSDRPVTSPFSGSYQLEDTNNSVAPSPTVQYTGYKNYSKVFLVAAIIIFILGFIGGIVMGNANQIIMRAAEFSSYNNSILRPAETAFNVALMFAVWLGMGMFGLASLGISWHLKNQEVVVRQLDKIIAQNSTK